MSNRSRRRLLHEWRTRAIVWAGDSPPDTIQSMEEWNRWHRDAFRFLGREPLCFPDNIRPDAGLISIQVHNQAAPFNPLSDPMPDRPEHLLEFGNRNDPLFLWQKTEAAISDALEYLEPARRIARPGFDWTAWAWWRNRARPKLPDIQTEKDPAAEWLHFFEDYPARFYLGLEKLRIGFTAVDQYGSAARNILRLDKRITEPELHALLCLAACWWALDALLGLSEDPEQWPRWKLDYVSGLIQDAERWLAEAYRLKQSDAKQAAIQDAWTEDSHRKTSAKGGEAAKGSAGIRLLALALRKEKPSASAEALFNAALSRAGDKDKPLLADAYILTTNAEAKQLFSTDPDGKPDGLPVGLSGWRKIAPPRRAKKS